MRRPNQPRRRWKSTSVNERVQRFTTEFFGRFDSNADGQIYRSELPLSIEQFGLWQLDENGDGSLTRTEVTHAIERRADL